VEVGRAYFETDKKHFTILDAPGHKERISLNKLEDSKIFVLSSIWIRIKYGLFLTRRRKLPTSAHISYNFIGGKTSLQCCGT
jgi:sulfate adenylyltransferase subunit 1 (EFTu-like GTPase family)